MFSPVMAVALVVVSLLLAAFVAFLIYAWLRYTPIILRIFEEEPPLLPLRVAPEPGGEDVRFTTADGLTLAGTYFRAPTPERSGVVVFCHEFRSDRWSVHPYVGHLRELGYDLFTFDFRNHGDSATEAAYEPMQWVTDRELLDLQAAIDYVGARPDADPAGVGIFGISKGANAALCVAAANPHVWGVATDGAFPTRGTMQVYMHRWAEIYITSLKLWKRLPHWAFDSVVSFVGWTARREAQRRRGCRLPDVEQAARRLSPRPLLMIHGEKDALIGPEIARKLFAQAGEPKELWIVPAAKHNRCREVAPEAYRERLASFVSRFGPRRPQPVPVPAPAPAAAEPVNGFRQPVAASAAPGEPLAPTGSGVFAPVTG